MIKRAHTAIPPTANPTANLHQWAVMANDNDMIETIATNLAIRFSFGETLMNPLIALLFVGILPAVTFYVIIPDIARKVSNAINTNVGHLS